MSLCLTFLIFVRQRNCIQRIFVFRRLKTKSLKYFVESCFKGQSFFLALTPAKQGRSHYLPCVAASYRNGL